jgi:hypothetical protein
MPHPNVIEKLYVKKTGKSSKDASGTKFRPEQVWQEPEINTAAIFEIAAVF